MKLKIIAAAGALISTGFALFAQVEFKAVDLGTLGGHGSEAYGLNNLGQVVGGSFTTNDAAYHAFYWNGTTMTDLGTLGGVSSTATSINQSGLIVGYSLTSNNLTHAFSYSNGIMSDLGTLGGGQSYAYGVNKTGQITGYSDLTNSTIHHAFIFTNGLMSDLDQNGTTSSEGYAINDSGQVAGTIYRTPNNNDFRDAFLFSNGIITNLGTFGGRNSMGFGINNSGFVVGTSDNSDNTADHPFLYNGGPLIDLGTFGGVNGGANAINNSGQIVGEASLPSGPSPERAFLYEAATMKNLNSLIVSNNVGTNLWNAVSINDSGQIVAQARNGHSFLLTPIPALNIAIGVRITWPSPSSGFILQEATGLIGNSWSDYGGPIFDDGTNKIAFVTPLLDSSFFRLANP